MRDDDADLVPLDPARLPADFTTEIPPDASYFSEGGLVVVVRHVRVNGVSVELRARVQAERLIDEPAIVAAVVNDTHRRLSGQVAPGLRP